MTEKLSAFIDDALYKQEVEMLLNELTSDNNKETLELYLLTREILQNNHSAILRKNISEHILQSIQQEMKKNANAVAYSNRRLSWRPSFAIAAVFMLGMVGMMTWWTTKTSHNTPEPVAVASNPAAGSTVSTTSDQPLENNLAASATVATDASNEPGLGVHDGFSPDPYLFAHQELAPMGSFHEPLPYVRTVSGTK